MKVPETYNKLYMHVGHADGGCSTVATVITPGYELIASEDLKKLLAAADELSNLKAKLALAKQLANNIVADLAMVAE